MTGAQDRPGRAEPVEQFHATSGRFVGMASLGVIAVLLVYLALTMRTVTGLRVGAGLVFLAVVVWVTQLRPRATAYEEELHLRNSVRDASLPLVLIDGVRVGRMLNVWVGQERYVCVGIGAPLRKMVGAKTRGPSSLLGWDRLEAYTDASTPPAPDQTATSYPDFVERRIVALVEDARRSSGPDEAAADQRPREVWAWPEITALCLTAALFLVTLLL